MYLQEVKTAANKMLTQYENKITIYKVKSKNFIIKVN